MILQKILGSNIFQCLVRNLKNIEKLGKGHGYALSSHPSDHFITYNPLNVVFWIVLHWVGLQRGWKKVIFCFLQEKSSFDWGTFCFKLKNHGIFPKEKSVLFIFKKLCTKKIAYQWDSHTLKFQVYTSIKHSLPSRQILFHTATTVGVHNVPPLSSPTKENYFFSLAILYVLCRKFDKIGKNCRKIAWSLCRSFAGIPKNLNLSEICLRLLWGRALICETHSKR